MFCKHSNGDGGFLGQFNALFGSSLGGFETMQDPGRGPNHPSLPARSGALTKKGIPFSCECLSAGWRDNATRRQAEHLICLAE